MSDEVTLTCPSRGSVVTGLVGPGGVQLTGGVGGTTTIDIPRDRSAVHWETHPPLNQRVSLLLDGYATQLAVSPALRALEGMARALPGEPRPPSVYLTGNVRRTDVAWLIEALEPDEETGIVRESDGVLVRIVVGLTLVEDRRPKVVRRTTPAERARQKARKEGRGSAARGRPIIVRKGDTLGELAARHKIEGGWRALAKANGIRDPRRLRIGQRLKRP